MRRPQPSRRQLAVMVILTATLAVALTTAAASYWLGQGEEPEMMTYQQAADTVEQLIRENTAHLTPAPRLVPMDSSAMMVPCSGPSDDQKTGTVMLERDYRLYDIDQSLNDSIVDQIRRYWFENGYRVVLDDGKPGNRKVVAKHPGNGFRVSVTEGQRVLFIRSQSNCVPEPPLTPVPTSDTASPVSSWGSPAGGASS